MVPEHSPSRVARFRWTTLSEPIEVVLARLDERTKSIKATVEEVKSDVQKVRANCATVTKNFSKRMNDLEHTQEGKLTGRDKALVYVAVITSLFSFIATIVAYLR